MTRDWDRERDLIEANNRLIEERRKLAEQAANLATERDALVAQLKHQSQEMSGCGLLRDQATAVVTELYCGKSWEDIKAAIGELGTLLGINSAEDCRAKGLKPRREQHG